MANKDHRPIAIVEDDMAQVAAAKEASRRMWILILALARKPVATLDMIDGLSDNMRYIDPALDVLTKHLVALREQQ